MELLEFIVELLKFIGALFDSLAWPAAIVGLFWMFKTQVEVLLLSLSSIKYGEWEIGFGRELERIKKSLGSGLEITEFSEAKAALEFEIETQEEGEVQKPQLESRNPLQTIAEAGDLCNDFPESAIVLAWSAVEDALLAAVMRLAISPDYPLDNSALKNTRLLKESDFMDRETVELIGRMRNLRNLAVHSRTTGRRITPSEAVGFVDIIRRLVIKIRAIDSLK